MSPIKLPSLLVAFAVVVLNGCGTKPGSASPGTPKDDSSNPAATSRPETADFKVTAEGISKEFFADEQAASAKYNNKYIELEGDVDTTIKFLTGENFILIAGPKKFENDIVGFLIYCTMTAKDHERLCYLGKSQKLSVFGRVYRVGGKMLSIEQVTFKELTPSPILQMKAEDLATDYASSGEAAQHKYVGDKYSRELILTGVVADLIEDTKFDVVILAGKGMTQVKCTFNKDDWKTLKIGDKVSIKGDLLSFDGKNANAPFVDGAILIKKN